MVDLIGVLDDMQFELWTRMESFIEKHDQKG